MKYVVTVNGKNYEVDVEQGEARVLSVTPVTQTAPVAAPAAAAPLPTPVAAVPAAAVAPAGAGEALAAPMPGTIVEVFKNPGDPVKTGEVVLILEAMKMENEIVATHGGTVTQVLVSKGAIVKTGDAMVIIQ
ncbi:MAG TPA: biotin/lipoyl-containing protein [Clostridia bacterium]